DQIILMGQQAADQGPFGPLGRAAANPGGIKPDAINALLGDNPPAGQIAAIAATAAAARKGFAAPNPATQLWQVRNGQATNGLLFSAGLAASVPRPGGAVKSVGDGLVTAVSRAIGLLEEYYHLGPFACVLGQDYFNEVQRPDD